MGQDEVYKYLKKRKTPASVNEIKKVLGTSSSSVNRCLSKLVFFKEIKKQKVRKGHFYFCQYKIK